MLHKFSIFSGLKLMVVLSGMELTSSKLLDFVLLMQKGSKQSELDEICSENLKYSQSFADCKFVNFKQKSFF